MLRAMVVTIVTVAIVAGYPNAVPAQKFWKLYDDFEGGLDCIDAQPDQERITLGKKWIRFVPEDRLSMDVEEGILWLRVTQAGDRDPGFKLILGWEPQDIIGLQFTIKVADLSEAGGWFGVLCTDEEPNWKSNNWIFGVSPSHQHDWGPETYFGSGSFGKLGGWEGSAYKDIPENMNMLRTIRLEWDSAAREMLITVDPGKGTEWKEKAPSNADLERFPWWSIYVTCDQAVQVAIDDVYVISDSLPFSVEPRDKLATTWGRMKVQNPI